MSTKPQIELFLENESGTQQVAYPFVESDHVSLSNGMDIDTMIRQDVSMPTVAHEDLSFKAGVGDQDVSSAIVDSSVAEMTIKGKTYQNILPEPSTHVLTNNKNMFKVNEGLDPNVEIVDGVSKSAILSGNTLVNMCDDGVADASDIKRFTHNYTSNGGTFEQVSDGIKATTTQDNTWLIVGYDIRSQQKKMMTIGKKYYGVADVTVHKLTNSDSCSIAFRSQYSLRQSATLTRGRGIVQGVFNHGGVDANHGWLAVGTNGQKAVVGDSFTVHSMSVYEITEEEVNLSYEELANKYPVKCVGMQSVKTPVLRTTGKNLFDKTTITEGKEFYAEQIIDSESAFVSDYIKAQPNTTYRMSGRTTGSRVHIFDKDKNLIYYPKAENDVFTTPNDDRIYYMKINGQIAEKDTWQLEQGTVATSYEPYKTNILTAPEDLELRGIGNVKDELNVATGELTQRIGEIVLDGSEDWTKDGNIGYYLTMNDLIRASNYQQVLTSDRLPIGEVYIDSYTTTTLSGYANNSLYPNQNWLYIVGSEFSTIDELKTWLSQNPTTVQYQRATESIKTVDLSSFGNWDKVVLDGSESWSIATAPTQTNTILLQTGKYKPTTTSGFTEKLKTKNNDQTWSEDYEAITFNVTHSLIQIRISKTIATNIDEWKEYLANTPMIVYCMTNAKKSNSIKEMLSFSNGHIQLSSGADNSLIPTLDYQAKTSNSYVMDLMKANTRYTMKAKSASGTFTIDGTSYGAGTNGTFTTPSSMTNKFLVVSNKTNEEVMILEGDVTDKTIPYFKGIKSAFEDEDKIEVLSTSQNILDTSKIVQGDLLNSGIIASTGGSADLYCYTEDFIPCPNIKHPLYVHRTIDGVYSSSTYYIFFFDEDKRLLQPRTVSNTFTIPDGAKYLRIMVHKGDVDVSRVGIMVTNSGADRFNQSVGGLQNSTKIPLLSPLRSLPNGVCDELIIDRMKKKATLIQRVREVVLNGNENWVQSQVRDNHYVAMLGRCSEVGIPEKYPSTLLCSHFINQQPYAYDREGINVHVNYNLHIGFLKNRLSDASVNSCKKWLSQNPVIVHHELATPVVTEIDLEGFPYIYKDGHIFLNSEIAPVTEIKYSINQQHQIEASNQDIIRHQKEIDYLYKLIGEYVRVDYKNTLLSLNLELK